MKRPVLFILLGQSNAVGHGVELREEDKLITPLKNVFGLTWEDNPYPGETQVVWRGYVSDGMNLGEEIAHRGSLANYLASMWQRAFDRGEVTEELYIVNISLGAQGVTEKYMWYPRREPRFVPGPIGTADISLTPYAENILSRVKKYFDKMGVVPKTLIHWRGGENDYLVPIEELEVVLPGLYREIFSKLWGALGAPAGTVLHRIVCDTRAFDFDPEGGRCLVSMGYINNCFNALAREFENVSVFDSAGIPGFTLEREDRGIFVDDKVHFSEAANKWVAGEIFEELKQKG